MVSWRDNSVGEKARLVEEINSSVNAGYETVAEACVRLGVVRSTYYRWRDRVERYDEGDKTALDARSSRPRRHGRRTAESVREEVVRLAKTGKFRSPTAIARHMGEQGSPIHPGTAIKILEEEGLYGFVTKPRDNGSRTKVRGWL